MADLKCVVESCTYNKDCLCSKGDIMVAGKHACNCDDTCCESFDHKREGADSFTSSIAHPSKTISIDCEAVKCVHNSNTSVWRIMWTSRAAAPVTARRRHAYVL